MNTKHPTVGRVALLAWISLLLDRLSKPCNDPACEACLAKHDAQPGPPNPAAPHPESVAAAMNRLRKTLMPLSTASDVAQTLNHVEYLEDQLLNLGAVPTAAPGPNPAAGVCPDVSAEPAAPRAMEADLADEIALVCCFTAADGVNHVMRRDNFSMRPSPLSRTMICVIQLRNGFTVTGTNACVSDDLFDAALGAKLAQEDAERKVRELLGFRLADRLAAKAAP